MLKIKVGGLDSIPSVYFKTSPSLKEFNTYWHSGRVPRVQWDLREIAYGKINVAAASLFLALAHRVRQYTRAPQEILLDYHPKIFAFLTEIKFFNVADEYDLFELPYPIGGYSDLNINPRTQILSLDQFSTRPDIFDIEELAEWKRVHREQFRKLLIADCSDLFRSVQMGPSEKDLPLIISRICAEIAINSLLWGQATAFLGLQRSRNLIGISVIDVGKGFRQSFKEKNIHSEIMQSANGENADLYACLLASITNEKHFGLKRAIENVISAGGNISIGSGSAEVHWGEKLWCSFIEHCRDYGVKAAISEIGKLTFKAGTENKKDGYVRIWNNSIRGVRVNFSMPVQGGN
ncbi:hypothetical protein [Pseudoalteromonas sp. DY56-GL79]|uniref:hypothetical protein n=1 Tax=Pseudoalteromonas sp. DY56-GL79 TaxID=2967131 RepID=UPI003529E643